MPAHTMSAHSATYRHACPHVYTRFPLDMSTQMPIHTHVYTHVRAPTSTTILNIGHDGFVHSWPARTRSFLSSSSYRLFCASISFLSPAMCFEHSMEHSMGHSIEHSMGHSMKHSMGHSMGHSIENSMEHSMEHSMEASMEVSFSFLSPAPPHFPLRGSLGNASPC